MTHFIVRYAEIALKGQNRGDFENQLVRNIRRAMGLDSDQVERQQGQILVRVPPEKAARARDALAKVFGIAWFAEATLSKSTLESIATTAYDLAGDRLDSSTSFAVRAERSVKTLPINSQDVHEYVGAHLQHRTAAPVDLDDPDLTVYVSLRGETSYVYTDKIPGARGLPVGTSGRVLSLISGGFDSIASSYYLAKRGARVDFLHFHVFPHLEGLMSSKMPRLWRKLSAYTRSHRVFLADYTPFQMAVLGLKRREQRYELVAFRRLMARVGERLAERYGYEALVLGDSLGQVASQTLENITAVDEAVSLSVFRPLIGMDKMEVVALVRSLGLEEEAVAPYKDCCSIIARHPSTVANLEAVRSIEQAARLDQVAEEITAAIETVSIPRQDTEPVEAPAPVQGEV